jgi:hypothetical protein
MEFRKMINFDSVIDKLKSALQLDRFESGDYEVNGEDYLLQINIDSVWDHTTEYQDGFPLYYSKLLSMELHWADLYDDNGTYYRLDRKQTEYLCKRLNANSVIKY